MLFKHSSDVEKKIFTNSQIEGRAKQTGESSVYISCPET